MKTAEELNAVQAEWIALDSHGPKKEIDRVCKLMEQNPKCYVSANGALSTVIYHGLPLCAPIKFALAIELCKKHGGRTDVVRNSNTGKWQKL